MDFIIPALIPSYNLQIPLICLYIHLPFQQNFRNPDCRREIQLMLQGSEHPLTQPPLSSHPHFCPQHRFWASLLHLKESTKASQQLMLPPKVYSRQRILSKGCIPTEGSLHLTETGTYARTGEALEHGSQMSWISSTGFFRAPRPRDHKTFGSSIQPVT